VSGAELLLAQPLPQAVALALVHFLWQGAVAALGFALVMRVLPRSASTLRYAAGCTTLAIMLIIPIATTIRLTAGLAPSPEEWRGLQVLVEAGTGGGGVEVQLPASSRLVLDSLRPWQPWILLVWVVGVAITLGRLTVAQIIVLRIRRAAEPASQAVIARFRSVARQLDPMNRVRVAVTRHLGTPTVSGWLRPMILIPASIVTLLPPDQLELILAHELAHVRRHDVIVNVLQAIVEALLFFHPAVWWVSRQVRIEREHCCDQRAVRYSANPLDYARALTEVAALRARGAPAAALGFMGSQPGGTLMSRIERILAPARTPDRAALPITGTLGVLLCVVSLVPVSSRAVAQSADRWTIEQQVELLERANLLRDRQQRQVLAALDDADPLTRAAAARVLGEGDDDGATSSRLLDLLVDPHSAVRKESAVALGLLSHVPAIPRLKLLLADPDPGVREQAAYAIAIIGSDHEPDVTAILDLLDDPAPNVRKGAARALGVMGSVRAIRPLGLLLDDPDPGVRSAARGALDRLPGPDSGPT